MRSAISIACLGVAMCVAGPALVAGQAEAQGTAPQPADQVNTKMLSLPASGWAKLADALEELAGSPSKKHCSAVSKLLPTTMPLMVDDSVDASRAFQQLEAALPSLERLIVSRSRPGVKLAFQLFVTMADGHLAEELDIMLGKLIRLDPVMFLEEFQSVTPPYPIEVLGGLVGNLGDGLEERAECNELHLRLKAIESVTQANLARVRAQCQTALKKSLQSTCKAA